MKIIDNRKAYQTEMPAPEKKEVLDRMTGVIHGRPSLIEKIYRITNEELKGGQYARLG